MKQRNTGLIVVVVVLIFIVLVLGGYVFYTDFYKKNNTNQENINNPVTTKKNSGKITYSEIEMLFANAYDNYLNYTFDAKTIEDIDNQDRLMIAITNYVSTHENDTIETVTKEQLEEELNNTIFSGLTLNHEDILCSCGKVLWTYSDGIYKKVDHGHGACSPTMVDYVIEDIDIENGNYEATVNYIFNTGCEGEWSSEIYGSFEDASNKKNQLTKVELGDSYETYIKNIKDYVNKNYEQIEDNLDEYQYTFEKADGKLRLVNFNMESEE